MHSLTAHPYFSLHGRTLYELVTGQTPDISEYAEFGFYQTVWYFEQETPFPEDRRKLDKWIGVADHVGQALCNYRIVQSGHVIVCSTIQAFSEDEFKDQQVISSIKEFDKKQNRN